MIILFLILLFLFLTPSRRSGGFSNVVEFMGKVADDVVRHEKQLLEESKEAMLSHKEEIRAAFARNEAIVLTLPCAWRLIITPDQKCRFKPCSENIVV